MGRGRGKGKKRTAIAAHEDPGSGEEGKIPAYRRRGRPQKPLKDEIEEEEEEDDEGAEKIEEDGEDAKGNISGKDVKNHATIENGRKRKRSSQVKENIDSVGVENGIGAKSSPDDSMKSVGFRQNGSRRKNKPRRAAEAGVECNSSNECFDAGWVQRIELKCWSWKLKDNVLAEHGLTEALITDMALATEGYNIIYIDEPHMVHQAWITSYNMQPDTCSGLDSFC